MVLDLFLSDGRKSERERERERERELERGERDRVVRCFNAAL